MNKGDINTFYPLNPDSGLESAYYPYNNSESSYDDLDDSKDNQGSIEDEGEEDEVPGVRDKCPFGEFRTRVRAKKQELKNQYGEGFFSIGECGIKPSRVAYNPNVKISTTYWPFTGCGVKPARMSYGPPHFRTKNNAARYDADTQRFNNDMAKWYECQNRQGKVAIQGNEQAYDSATVRWNGAMAVWNKCREENKGIWVSGWRKEWRKFKKAGGLNQLRDQCRGVVPPPHASAPPRSCADMERDFDIIAGQSWGTADPAIKNEWIAKGCKGTAKAIANKIVANKETDMQGSRTSGEETPPTDNKKMYIIIAVIVLIVIATIFIIKRQMK
jgi:hypothetical protein